MKILSKLHKSFEFRKFDLEIQKEIQGNSKKAV